MKKYFIHNGGAQEGPYTIEELVDKRITKSTPIWYEGIKDWTEAGKVDELTHLFKITTPPPFNSAPKPPPLKSPSDLKREREDKFDKKLGKTLFIIGLVAAIILVGGLIINSLSYSNNDSNLNDDASIDTYQEKVMSVGEFERNNPLQFLSAHGTYHENFFGTKFKVDCKIKSSATTVTFKDIVVRVNYYTKTNTKLGSKDYTIYEEIYPNSEKTVRLKIDNYQDVSSIEWEVISAIAK